MQCHACRRLHVSLRNWAAGVIVRLTNISYMLLKTAQNIAVKFVKSTPAEESAQLLNLPAPLPTCPASSALPQLSCIPPLTRTLPSSKRRTCFSINFMYARQSACDLPCACRPVRCALRAAAASLQTAAAAACKGHAFTRKTH